VSQAFQRTKETFICGNCGHFVIGNGYTNHCPACLWSRHVDINPGDRAETCGGLMEPVEITGVADRWTIVHRCQKCRITRNNKTVTENSTDMIAAIAAARG